MNYELIVIGGGSAGHAAAATAAARGLKCALIAPPGPLGGLCVLRGCMPSKILLETSNRMREIRDAGRFGIDVGPPQLNIEKLRERLEELGENFRDYRRHEMKTAGYELLRGTASFLSSFEISLTNEAGQPTTLHAKAFVIATGSAPGIPEIDGLADTPYWTSDDVVKLPDVPASIAILGSGAIGMEAAHCFEGFGSSVTVIARGKEILGHHDTDLSEAIEAESKERGIQFFKQTELESVRHLEGKFHLTFKENSHPPLQVDALLIATGRTPQTAGLHLEKIGIAMDDKLILIDDRCVTSLPHIFAAGDCASPVPVVHIAVVQGQIAGNNAERVIRDGHATSSFASWNRDTAMNGLFTDPQCVEIGINEKSAAKKGIKILAGKILYNDQGKGMIVGSRHGFTKIIANASTRKIIGAVGVGPVALETSHIAQLAIETGMTLEDFHAITPYHPTLAEAWASAAQNAIEGETGCVKEP
jgi:pyruvate/2-oxoglutarate dehydrogenase complex dihydrolipoamide dehydrogenase (E3) component